MRGQLASLRPRARGALIARARAVKTWLELDRTCDCRTVDVCALFTDPDRGSGDRRHGGQRRRPPAVRAPWSDTGLAAALPGYGEVTAVEPGSSGRSAPRRSRGRLSAPPQGPRSTERGLVDLDDHQPVALGIVEPEQRRHRAAHAADLGVHVHVAGL